MNPLRVRKEKDVMMLILAARRDGKEECILKSESMKGYDGKISE